MSDFDQKIAASMANISKLPPSELKYYLFILVHALKRKAQPAAIPLLDETCELIKCLEQFSATDPAIQARFSKITLHYQRMTQVAQMHTLGAKISNIVLQIGSSLVAFITGILGGLIGGFVGLARGIFLDAPLTGFTSGVLIGCFLGGSIGFRVPKKIFKDPLQRQVKFALDGLNRAINNLQEPNCLSFSAHFNTKLQEIKTKHFTNDAEFEAFLQNEVDYKINTVLASFIKNRMLHGFLGNHVFIQFNIKDSTYLIEYAPEPAVTKECPNPTLSQTETRRVTGRTLIEMLALHEKLKETNPFIKPNMLAQIKPGDNDCFNYVSKVLLGTNQESTKLQRFSGLNDVGRQIGFFYEKLSVFEKDFFETCHPQTSNP